MVRMLGWFRAGRRARFLLEPADALLILRECGGQQLERDLATEPRVFGQVNYTHPARANQRERLIVAEAAAHERWILLLGGHHSNHISYLPGDEAVRLLARLQQRFDLEAQLVVIAASPGQELHAIFRRKIHRCVEQLADAQVLFRCHRGILWGSIHEITMLRPGSNRA